MMFKIITVNDFSKWCRDRGLRFDDDTPELGGMIVEGAPSAGMAKWVVRNFIQERDIALLYAPQKVGKTHFAYALGQSMALGTGLTCHFKVEEPRSTIIFNGEMRKDQLVRRKRSAERQVGVPKPDGAYCEHIAFGYQENEVVEDLSAPEGQQRFLDVIDECNARHPDSPHARVFILDSLKTLTNKGDIIPAKWNSLFRFLNRLRTEHPWTFIIIHHTNKLGGDSGTQDKAIKVDVRARLSRDSKAVLAAASDYFPSLDKDSCAKLDRQLARRFSGERKDAIWFLFMLEDLRDLPRSAGRPFLMEMLPEDNPPRWESTELDDSGLLGDAGGRALDYDGKGIDECVDDVAQELNPSSQATTDSSVLTPEANLTYEQLKKASREEVVAALRHTVEKNGCSSRKSLGKLLGTDKEGIDYLMRKHSLKNEDIGLKSGKTA